MLLTYFILKLDALNKLFSVSFIFAAFIATILSFQAWNTEDENLMKSSKRWLCIAILSILLTIFTPTTKQAALIFLSGQEDVVATAKNLPKLTKLGTDYLIELLEEGKKDDSAEVH